MMKSGAPPDKFRVLHRLFHIEFHGFTGRIDFQGLSLFRSWSYLNFFIDGPFKHGDTLTVNDLDKANVFSDYFKSVFKYVEQNVISSHNDVPNNITMLPISISEIDVYRILKKLDSSKIYWTRWNKR